MTLKAEALSPITLKKQWRRYLVTVAIALIFVAAMWLLSALVRKVHLAEILAYAHQLPNASLLLAITFTALSYGVLTLYDFLGIKHVNAPLSYRVTAPISFSAFAVGHNLGLASVSGGAIRYRAYSVIGLASGQIAQLLLLIPLTFALGASLMVGCAFIWEPQEALAALALPPNIIRLLGVALITFVACYLLAAFKVKSSLNIRSLQFSFPRPAIAIAQVLVGALDLIIASAVLYVLLPDFYSVSYPLFLGAYLLAVVAGMISNVPGGIGVFESIIVLLLPSIPVSALLGALVVYRGIYYFLPLVAALLLIVWREMSVSSKQTLKKITVTGGDWCARVVPQATSLAVFCVGITLVLGAAIPIDVGQLLTLRKFIPLQILEMSHLLSSVVGLGLLIVAHGLYKRLRVARDVTLALLAVAILASLMQAGSIFYALILVGMLGIVFATKNEFYRGGKLLQKSLNFEWAICVLLVIGASLWLGLFVHRHTQYTNELWWHFTFKGDAARMLRAEFSVVLLFIVFLIIRVLRGQPITENVNITDQLPLIKSIISNNKNCEANVALLGDKQFVIDPNNDAFIMYQKSGRTLIALGDPVGNEARFESLAWAFREKCDQTNHRCAFYQVSKEHLPLYIDLGLAFSKLGEEARLFLPGFSLEGSKRAVQRQTINRAHRDGAVFSIVSAKDAEALMPELKAISNQWLETKKVAEKGFSLGFFEPEYLKNFDFAIVKVNQQIVAFASLWKTQSKEEFSIDLMRFGDAAPKGIMDYLFVELFLWGKANEYQWFNLGMAPLGGMDSHALSPAWNKVASIIYRLGDNFYNFEGLYFYKNKFDPQWESRYLASKGGSDLPKVLIDISILISGGFKGLFLK